MSLTFKPKLRKLNQAEFLTAVVLLWPFSFGALIDMLGLPNSVKYVMDLAWILLLFLIMANQIKKTFALSKTALIILLWPICFFAFTLITYFLNYQSVLYYLWGGRNNFRFYVAFAAFIIFIKKDYINSYLKLFDVLFWLNAVVCFFQFFVLGIKWDFLGGFFGVQTGCNGYLNVFMVLMIIKSAVCYLNNRETLLAFILKSGTSLVLAALAELKFFFVEYVIIVLFALLITRFTFKKLGFICVGIVCVIIGYETLIFVFPDFLDFFSLENMLNNATKGGYTYAEALNRLTTIPVISKNYLTTGFQRTIGLGLGNCDTAAYDFLNTPFYERYSFLRYNWFSTAFTYLETGFIGLIFTFGFFVLTYFLALKKRKMESRSVEDRILCEISALSSVMCCVILIYNSSLRTEAAYMAYFMTSLAFIGEAKSISRKV
ncbi:MAG: hypothetical protein J6Q89_07865 [Clostridia bacterium]|nr:hypothetical protein [Clostridia bacterium]